MTAHTIPVAAGAACVRLRSSREMSDAVYLTQRIGRFYDCFAAERRLRQLLQEPSRCFFLLPNTDFQRWT